MGRPGVIHHSCRRFRGLSEQELFFAPFIQDDIERAGRGAINSSVKIPPRVRRQPVDEDAKRVNRIDATEGGLPLGGKRRVGLRRQVGLANLRKQLVCSFVRKAEIRVKKALVKYGSTQEAAHLLFFYRVARRGQHVSAAGENGPGYTPFERKVEGEGSVFQGNNGITSTELNAICKNQVINSGRVDRQRIDRVIQFVR